MSQEESGLLYVLIFYLLFLTLVLMRDEGGKGLNLSIPFLFVKTIEKVIRLRSVLNLFFEK